MIRSPHSRNDAINYRNFCLRAWYKAPYMCHQKTCSHLSNVSRFPTHIRPCDNLKIRRSLLHIAVIWYALRRILHLYQRMPRIYQTYPRIFHCLLRDRWHHILVISRYLGKCGEYIKLRNNNADSLKQRVVSTGDLKHFLNELILLSFVIVLKLVILPY